MPRRVSRLCTLLAALAILGSGACWAQTAAYLMLHSFQGAGGNDGASVYSGVILGRDGVLYGTTWGGGNGAGGTVFRMNPDGSGYAVLHRCAAVPDAHAIYGGLIQGRDGALYGTSHYGGTEDAGAVLKLRTDGSGYQILHSFAASYDGRRPWAGLVQARNGWLYGTTLYGGDGTDNNGTVFRINTNGTGYAMLHSFRSDFRDGQTPYAGLIEGQDGGLYGVTSSGGSTLLGTVFRIGPDGSGHQVLYTFQSGTGYWPRGALTQGRDGMLYGTTYSGGPINGGGVVYRVGTNGLNYAVLRAFEGGANPWSQLVQAGDGALYGTTEWKGTLNGGTVFRLRPDGSEYQVLHNFPFSATGDGAHPIAGLIDGGGALYGTTQSGGGWGLGTVYRMTLASSLGIAASSLGPRLTIIGLTGLPYRLETSANGSDWQWRADLVLTNGATEFIETDSGGTPARLYRVLAR
jgi:uncharacterized repeat protein (TIGR03803 family)